jgi:hypothetical protein
LLKRKRARDLLRLEFFNSLDKKEFSNQEKRDAAALMNPIIKAEITSIEQLEYELAIQRIELDHKQRSFRLLVKL